MDFLSDLTEMLCQLRALGTDAGICRGLSQHFAVRARFRSVS